MTHIIDGKAIAQEIRAGIRREIETLKAAGHRPPGLTVVLVGDNPASEVYVRNKEKAAKEAGFTGGETRLPAATSEAELLARIAVLNSDAAVDGILVQLPLPSHISEPRVIEAIHPDKDVDGFHPMNMGRLVAGLPAPAPCTPLGVMEMLRRLPCDLEGKELVVLGRSNIVGKPMALLALHKKAGANATVTVCHSATSRLAEVTRRADVIVAAIGRARFLKADMVKPGAVVIDVGINRQEDGKLCGDVDYEPVSKIASAITPVPGGVGPMTIAMLLKNTLDCYRRRTGA